MTRVALRISSSSVTRVPLARVVPCVLELLGHARPQAHEAKGAIIEMTADARPQAHEAKGGDHLMKGAIV
jgi:hypothetical protein